MKKKKKIVLLTLGEELLLGLTPNAHLTFVADALNRRGAALSANVVVSDRDEEIQAAFSRCWDDADAVITTGGLGPTVDDRAREAVAAVLGEELRLDPSVLRAIEARFARLGRPMTENNRKQAYRPAGAEVLDNPNGTAPGLWLERDGKLLIMLPGPPSELHPLFLDKALPLLERRGFLRDAESYLQLRASGIGESALDTRLAPCFDGIDGLEVAYCAHDGQIDCRLSFPDGSIGEDRLLELASACKERLGLDFLCYGSDSLAKVVVDLLRRRGRVLALAESCTGGAVANALTDIEGASECFVGGVVCYSEDAKIDQLGVPEEMLQQHTAVSPEVAVAMASGAAERLESDYALSVTGYLGAAPSEELAGTVHLGLHTQRGIWARRLVCLGPRPDAKRRAVNAALDWLRRELLAESPESDDEDANAQLRAESDKILRSLR